MIKIGSLFAGIGGFELGIERAIPNSSTIWQVEQNKFCQRILKKHWPNATIYNDVKHINKNNVEPVDILLGGFPCQDISICGKRKGINEGKKSSLYFEMHRIISELRPRIVVMENVPAITNRGLSEVLGSLSEIGYDAEWTIISAKDFGAPHLRKRWFCVAYPNAGRSRSNGQIQARRDAIKAGDSRPNISKNYWGTFPVESPLCNRNDGIPDRLAKLRALGNAIVPQCSEWIGQQILKSGLLEGKTDETKN